MNYTRIDARLDTLKWEMEDAQRTMNDMMKNLKRVVESNDMVQIAEFAPHYSSKYENAYKVFARDAEEIKVLVKIKESLEA